MSKGNYPPPSRCCHVPVDCLEAEVDIAHRVEYLLVFQLDRTMQFLTFDILLGVEQVNKPRLPTSNKIEN